jgi:hypothetical protein
MAEIEAQRSARRHTHQMEEFNNQNRWDSCCFRLNKQAVLFFSHYTILVILLIVSVIGVFSDHTNRDIWLNLLMLLVGAIMPAPSLKHEERAAAHQIV